MKVSFLRGRNDSEKEAQPMQLLEDRIRKDGKVYDGDILKVDGFLNHRIDVGLVCELGKEF